MGGEEMLIEERQQLILNELSKNKKVIAADLSKLLNVSIDTIRRDLIILEDKKLLKRTRGGAVSNDIVKITKPKYFTGRDIKDINPYYDVIAEKACEFIKEAETSHKIPDNNEKVYVMSIGEKTLVFSADEKCAELFNKMVKLNR